jgi:hypothetical protein
MCNIGDDLKRTNFGLTPWKGEGSLINQAYIKPRQEAKANARSAKQAEAERQAMIDQNVGAINTAFGNRQSQYDALGKDLRQQYDTYLSQQRGQAQRRNKFGLARAGLTGGSAAIDADNLLRRESDEATLNAERQARKGVADLMGQDEAARTQLISLAQTGGNIGNAAAQSASRLSANLQGAQAAGNVQGLGDVFGATAQAYRAREDAAQRRRGLKDATESIYSNAFSRG